MKLTDYLSSVEDPRVVGRCKHKLSDILLIALITYLCGGEDYTDMHQLATERAEELSPLLELPNGLPSVDTFERVLGRINPSSLLACLNVYGATLVGELRGKQVSLDGKTIRASRGKKGSTHILSAWVNEHKISLSQVSVSEKTNEITCIPEVLDSLELEGAIVTIDAMGTQAKIAEQIVAEQADYVLSLKGNQKHLFEDVQDAFTSRTYTRFQHLTQDNDHGRVEERRYTAISSEEAMIEPWAGLRSIIQVERSVYNKSKETQSAEKQYYISSLYPQDIEALAGFIRGHWGIENS